MDEEGPPKFQPTAILGTGAYGTVYKATDRNNPSRVVALKRILVPASEEGIPMTTIREISALKQLEAFDHPNIVKLYDVCLGRRTARETVFFLVFEFVDQDLHNYVKNYPSTDGLPYDTIRSFMKQVLNGMHFLHLHRIVHRDVKPANILVTSNGVLKIADFGLSRVYGFKMALTTVVVTLWYRAPEVILQNSYASPVDIWSCGCIFAELHSRRPLFQGQTDIEVLHKIFAGLGLPPASEWSSDSLIPRSSFAPSTAKPWAELVPRIIPEAIDLIKLMLTFDQHQRISAQQALQHAYFNASEASSSEPAAKRSRLEDDCKNTTTDSGFGSACSDKENVCRSVEAHVQPSRPLKDRQVNTPPSTGTVKSPDVANTPEPSTQTRSHENSPL